MQDLYLGLAIMIGLSLMLALETARWSQRASGWVITLFAGITLIALVLYIRDFWDHVSLAQWLPYSNLIIVGNWFPLATGALSGFVFSRLRDAPRRRIFVVTALFGVGVYALYSPLLGEPPQCADRWDGRVCRQTDHNSCSAAAAATLLEQFQIEATEQEMAVLCLTRNGTTWPGLYRGLKLKTAGTPWKVRPFACDCEELHKYAQLPIIIAVGLDAKSNISEEMRQEGGWIPGVQHSVVMFQLNSAGDALIGDPARGLEVWSSGELKMFFRGHGMQLYQ